MQIPNISNVLKRTLLSLFYLPLLIFPLCQAQSVYLDLSKSAFSTFGSYMAISKTEFNSTEGLFLRDISGNRLWQWNGIFRIEVIKNGIPVAYTTQFTPEKLTLNVNGSESVEITFQANDILRVRGRNVELRLTQTIKDANSYYIPLDENSIRAQMGGYAHYFIRTLSGKMNVDGIQTLERGDRDKLHLILDFKPSADGTFEVAVQQYTTGIKPVDFAKSFDKCVAENKNSFSTFLKIIPPASKQYEQTRFDASYVNWSSVAAPKGFLKRNTMLMSKVNMRAAWSWDHCFNALASVSDPSLAYDQFILPFDYLDDLGAVPDIMIDHNVTRGFVKPPIHGWALQKLQAKGLKLTSKQQKECYAALEKWTMYWFLYMDDDKNGFPQYNHGNDSGWDNSTYFDKGYSVESADLCAFLALQMECLSDLANKLGKAEESLAWKNKSSKLIKDMIIYFWDGKRFVSKRTIDKSHPIESHSLMRFMPLVLGKRLPESIRREMLADLKSENGNITAFGLASESPTSPLYEADGYWRGPIWAPTTYLLVEGLRQAGEYELAKNIALKFCDLCKNSGFAENFNALTGAPLRDSGYTWTSSVFLLLAGEYAKQITF
jgi:putative isomerase